MLVKNRGFTIVELMIVVAIVAILAALAGPSFRELMAMMRVKTAATDIHLSLMRARSEAIKRNTNVTIATASGGWTAGWAISDGTTTVENHGAISGGAVSISGVSPITYSPNGRAAAATTPIQISLSSSDTTTARCVTISLSGQPTIKGGSC